MLVVVCDMAEVGILEVLGIVVNEIVALLAVALGSVVVLKV